MKKLIAVILILIGFMGCKKSSTQENALTLTGKWYYKTSTLTQYTNGTPGNPITTTYSSADFIVFNSSGTGEVQESSTESSFNYIVNGSNISITYPKTQNDLGSTSTGTIKQLTATTLEIVFQSSSTANNITESQTDDFIYSR